MNHEQRNAKTAQEFIEGAVPIKEIIWGSEPYPAPADDLGQRPSQSPVAILDLTNHPLINITDLVRLYQIDMPDGEGATAYTWEPWNEPGNYLIKLTLSYEAPVALAFSIIFCCASPDHWSFLRWIAENEGMVPLADEAGWPGAESRAGILRSILLVQVGGAEELATGLGGIKTAEAEAQKGEKLSGREVIMTKFEGKRYLSFSEIASALSSWLDMPYQGTETLILEAVDGDESIPPLSGISPQLQMVLQEVAEQENVRVVLLGGIPHMIRLDWLNEIGERNLERTDKRLRQESIFPHPPLEAFTAGTIPVVAIMEAQNKVKGFGMTNDPAIPIALVDLANHSAVDLDALSQQGTFEPGAATEFSWDLAAGHDDILVRLTCTYYAPTRGRFALLFSFLQHSAFLRWVLEHDNLLPLADAKWMQQQESSVPQILLSAQDDELARKLRIALIAQALTSPSGPPTPEEVVRILFGIRRFLSLQELATIAEHMWAMPAQGNEEARIPNVMESSQARLRVQNLSRDFRDLIVWLLEHKGLTSGLYQGEIHLFTTAWVAEQQERPLREIRRALNQRHTKRGKQRKKGKRHATPPLGETPIIFTPPPAPTSPMGQATLEDGARVRAYPYLYSFVRPLVPGEFAGHQIVSEEQMSISTYVLVARLDPTIVTRTRIPITTAQAECFQAFGVLERDELSANDGPFTLPDEKGHLELVAASTGLRASFLDYPKLELSEATVAERARQLVELRLRIWSDITNDQKMYAQAFIPAFVCGYQLGSRTVLEAKGKQRADLLQHVCARPAPSAHHSIEQILQGRMKEMGVNTLFELL